MKILRALFTTSSQPRVCSDLRSWAQVNHAECKTIYPARTIVRKPPRTIEPAPDPSFEKLYRVPAPERTLVQIHRTRLCGAYSCIILLDNQRVVPPNLKPYLEERPGHEYWYLYGETIHNPPHSVVSILVDPIKLEQGLEAELNTESQP